MRIVKISGGLGNQMFQYAFSLALKHAGNSDVQLDLSTYRAKSDYNGIDLVHNGFELSNLFDITFSEASPKDVARLSYQPTNLLNRVLRKYFTKKTHFIDKKSSYQPELLLLKSHDIYFEGNWQTEKYFITIEDEIRNTFTFKKTLTVYAFLFYHIAAFFHASFFLKSNQGSHIHEVSQRQIRQKSHPKQV